MALRSFKSVTKHLNGLGSRRLHRKHLTEEVVFQDISAVKAITVGSNADPIEKDEAIDEFFETVQSMNADGSNIILTAIAF